MPEQHGTTTTVREIMRPIDEVVHLHEAVSTARDRFDYRKVRALPVLDGDRLVGVITRSDIERFAATGDLEQATVHSMTAPKVFHCFDDTPLADAAATMRDNGINYLAVLDRGERLVGMVDADALPERDAVREAGVAQREGEDDSGAENPKLGVYTQEPRLHRQG